MSKPRNFHLLLPVHPHMPVKFRFDAAGRMHIFWWPDGVTPDTWLDELLALMPITLPELEAWVHMNDRAVLRELPPTPAFEDFYSTYPNKVGKAAAEKAWAKLGEKDKVQAVAHLEAYLKRKAREGTALQYPATYINQKPWKD